MKSLQESCVLRPEVLKGDLQDAIFAADFGYVIGESAPKVYQDPKEFFQNTHPAQSLRKIVKTIFERLADPNEAGAVIRLSTGYGGGKTHTLIALWHLAKNIANITLGTELLPAAGRPDNIIVVGADGEKFGTEVCGRYGDIETHSLWGDLAYKLGGKTGYSRVKNIDKPETVPDSSLIRAMLPIGKPILILLDEIVIYMAKLSEQRRKALLAFIGSLISEIIGRSQSVLVITDPSNQPSYQKEAEDLIETINRNKSTQQLDEVLGRKMSDFDPIGDESAQVIIRRLFEQVDTRSADEVSADYFNAYKIVASEYPELLPSEAKTHGYAERIKQCYPFHPRLLDTARDRLGALQDFQKSRGTLRLFARILRDIWESNLDISLITAGDLNWTSDRIQSDLLQRLNRDNFKPAVDADIVHHASRLDEEFSTDVHRRVASALLLESLPLSDSSAMDKSEITLAVLRPTDVGHEPSEAIDRLMSVCWHTYKDNSGQKFQFRYEPNVNKLIEERAGQILREDAKSHVMATVQNHYKGHTFKLIAYPGSPQSVRDSAELKLLLCDTEAMAQAACDYEDNSNPDSIRPRAFRNAIFGLAPTPSLFNDAIEDVRRLMAAEDISKEQRRGIVKEQVDSLIGSMRKNANIAALRSFNRVIFHGRPSMTLTEKYLVSDEGPMAGSNGQARLKAFLDDNKLIYQSNDVIDIGLLLDMIKGATPSLTYQGAYPASAVHERALASNKLKLMPNENPVRESILKAVKQGELVVRIPDGNVYDKDGCVTGQEGARTRDPNRELKTLKLESDVFLATLSAPCVQNWLKVDDKPIIDRVISLKEAADIKGTTQQKVEDAYNIGQIDSFFENGEFMIVANGKFVEWTPTIPKEAEANTWEGAINYARNRPLMKLELKSTSPDSAVKLIEYAQPFSAKTLNQSVLMSGTTKDGGSLNFKVDNVKHNSTLNPVKVSRDFVRVLESMSKYEAKLSLDFGDDGAVDTSSRFEDAQNKAEDNIGIYAKFGAEKE